MRFFCYGRKSVYSDHSDSVDNQEGMCRDYVSSRFPGEVDSFICFQDEDFSGANTDRPGLKEMMRRVRARECDALVVYQLDRLSRNVRDFSNLYAELDSLSVKFISLKENIDTATPIGRAMMYVTVIFAQMERETTAVRVLDNMRGLSKKGYWTGGNPPTGYVRQRVVEDGRKHVIIVPDPDGVAYVRKVFSDFLSMNCSLQHMETAYRDAGVRTITGKFFSSTQLYKILTMPFCVEATPEVYDFYAAKGCQMDPGSPRSAWDGSVGVMIYGRSTERNKKHELQPPSEWIVSLGRQEPFIPASEWLEVQSRFTHNKCIKDSRWPVPLLKGVLRCGKCGTLMQVARKARVDGSCSSWYYCRKRMREGADVCDMRHIKCEILDDRVLEVFRGIAADPDLIQKYVERSEPAAGPDLAAINQKIAAQERKIEKLAASLALADGSSAARYIISEMESLDAGLSSLRQEATAAEAAVREKRAAAASAKEKAEEIRRLISGLDGFTPKERNEIVRSVVKSCAWDGETLFLSL